MLLLLELAAISNLLVALLRRQGDVATRDQLLKEVWGYASSAVTRTIDTHVAELRRKLEVLQGHCERLGRPYDRIEKTTLDTVNLAPGGMRASDVVQKCRDLSEIGIDQAIVNMPNVESLRPLEIIGKEVIPEVAGL